MRIDLAFHVPDVGGNVFKRGSKILSLTWYIIKITLINYNKIIEI